MQKGFSRTEEIDPRYADLDTWPDHQLADALIASQAMAITAAAERLRSGSGRLIYVGAGASARLAVQDGVELTPTFGWRTERLLYLLAGGKDALDRAVEGAEDDEPAGRSLIDRHDIGPEDVVIAVTASGRTPFVIGAVRAARSANALVIGMANDSESPLLSLVDHPIFLDSGPEVIAGSTRLAAGTAQKAALNVVSTIIMVRLHRTFGNLMADMVSTNHKLDRRRIDMVCRIANVEPACARSALGQANGRIKLAVLIARGVTPSTANDLIRATRGNLRAALATIDQHDDA